MNTLNGLQVLVRRRIPYISTGLALILGILFLGILILDIVMSPTKYAPDEMKTVYFILVVPNWLKVTSIISLIGILTISPLYFSARLHRPAL